jgi:hypothetical protein
VAMWKLQSTKSSVRDVKMNVDVAGQTVIERDASSRMVINWTVAPPGPARRSRSRRRGRAPAASAGSSRRRSCRKLAEDSGQGVGEPQEASRGSGKRLDIEDRGFEDLAGLSSEEARDTAATASAYV